MQDGIYKLSHDVVNPTGDKRYKYDWKRTPLFRKGTRFLVKNCFGRIPIGGTECITYTFVTIEPANGKEIYLNERDPLEKPIVEALVAALEQSRRSAYDVVCMHGSQSVLDTLIAKGLVKLEDIASLTDEDIENSPMDWQ